MANYSIDHSTCCIKPQKRHGNVLKPKINPGKTKHLVAGGCTVLTSTCVMFLQLLLRLVTQATVWTCSWSWNIFWNGQKEVNPLLALSMFCLYLLYIIKCGAYTTGLLFAHQLCDSFTEMHWLVKPVWKNKLSKWSGWLLPNFGVILIHMHVNLHTYSVMWVYTAVSVFFLLND